MRIKEVNYKIKCEMPNCKQLASIKIEKSGFLKFSGLYLCKDCLNELYQELAKRIVPKSPDNMLNKKSLSKGKINETRK